jgi:hypothetical protein
VRNAVVRRFRSTPQVDLAKPYELSFDLRVDELGQFDDELDTLRIYADQRVSLQSSPTIGWVIRAAATDRDGIAPRRWTLFDGDGKGNLTKVVDTGLDIQEGGVYSFRILVDPVANVWKTSLSANGGKFKTFEPQAIRAANTSQEPKSWTFLHFHWQMKGGNRAEAKEAKEKVGFSVDSIRIAPAGNEE